jgi:LuxR family transcriptional regulator, maltose regulon positive regulatory protein
MPDEAHADRFRRRPPTPGPHALRRPRLLEVMRRRFDVRLTVVVGGAGYGKSTLLAQAVEENAFDPLGTDVWLLCDRRDRLPAHLIAGLSTALTGSADAAASLEDVIDLLVLRSPDSVALVLDDAHVLDGSTSADVLAQLLEGLPANAQLVVGSRTMPRLGVRRLQASGAAVVIDEAQLGFTADELRELATTVGADRVDGLTPWPALAVLRGTLGHAAGIDYVWDEILDRLTPERRRALALVARFERIDDELVHVVAGAEWNATRVLDGLPLVDSAGDVHRLHDLWRDALAAVVTPAEAAPALVAAAELFEQRDELLLAARCYRDAGELGHLQRLVRQFAARPISGGLDRSEAEALRELLPVDLRNGPVGSCLRAIVRWNAVDHADCMRDLERTAAAHGDDELRALAWWRIVQRMGDVEPNALTVPDALAALAADGWPMARSAVALVRSHEAQSRADLEAALAPLPEIDGPDPRTRRAAVSSRLVALGQPELVQITLADVLAEGVSEAVSAQAVWLRGELRAADAWPIAASLPSLYGRRRLPDVQVPLLGVVASVALAAGAVDDARALAGEAMRLSTQTLPQGALYARVADALVALAAQGEDEARRRFEAMAEDIPLRPWPSWGYLAALAPIRALLDDTDWLDDLGLGPSLQTAVDAGRLLRALREGAAASVAAALPWSDPALLEVHVPAPMLCELAAAASATVPAAAQLLEGIPGRSRHLRGLAAHRNRSVRSAAAAIVARSPARPHHDLRIVTLGDLAVERSDGVPVERLDGKTRLRQLLAILVLERSAHRSAVARRLWPDLDADAAANNLRVSLHKLLAVIEPDRGPGASWWIRVEGDRIELAADGVAVDVDEFDRHLAAARLAEHQGVLSAAHEHYQAMGRLYRGELLPGVDDPAVVPERTRLQALAYNAACRQAELQLARGEPEIALRHGVEAERLDPLGERAHRLMIRAQLALGARSAAGATAERLVDRLAASGLGPEPETAALLSRLG